MKTKTSECHWSNDVSEFKEAKHGPYKTSTETYFTSETAAHVLEICRTYRYRVDCNDNNRENKIPKITKCDEENRFLFLRSLTGQLALNLQRLMTARM
jgi:hypothetical protein